MGYHVISPHANPPSYIILTPGRPVGTTSIFKVFGMTGPSSHRESNPQILLVSAGFPLVRLLRSAGATEDLFVTRELHQEPQPRIPTRMSLSSIAKSSMLGTKNRKTLFNHCKKHQILTPRAHFTDLNDSLQTGLAD